MRILLGIPHVPSEAFLSFLRELSAESDVAVLLWYENPWVLRVLRRSGVRVYFDNILARVESDAVEPGGGSPAIPDLARLAEFDVARNRIVGRSWPPEKIRNEVASAVRRTRAVLNDFRPELVGVWNGRPYLARALSELAGAAGAGVFYMERGLLPGSLVVDPLGVNAGGSLGEACWAGAGAADVSAEDLETARSFRAGILARRDSLVSQADACSREEVRQRLEVPSPARLVLVPAQLDWDSNIVYHSPMFDSNAAVLNAVNAAAGELGDVFVVFKPHPEDRPGRAPDIAGADRCRTITDVGIHSLIAASDAVVVRNSTVGLEAILHQKPVLALGSAAYTAKGFTRDLDDPGRLAQVLSEALEQGMTAEMRAAAERFLVQLLRDYLYFPSAAEPFSGSASARIAMLRKLAPGNGPDYGEGQAAPPWIAAMDRDVDELLGKIDALQRSRGTAADSKSSSLVLLSSSVSTGDARKCVGQLRELGVLGKSVSLSGPGAEAVAGDESLVVSEGALEGAADVVRAALGKFEIVMMLCADPVKLSAKGRMLARLLGEDLHLVTPMLVENMYRCRHLEAAAVQGAESRSISVVIPVYRARRYLGQAVGSALDQPETLEVVLVEDGSDDGSLAECRRLAEESPRVRLLQHPGGVNRGEAASRNLGVSAARGRYVAFLDADDYFLPGRFATSLPVLESDPAVDGVYEAVGTEFEDEAARREWVGPEDGLTTIRGRLDPEDLLEALVTWSHGYFCMGGILLRREVFARVGPFDEGLRLSPDTPMWWRVAAVCRLVGGRLDEAVAVRRRHSGNLYSRDHPEFGATGYRSGLSAYRWARARRLPPERLEIFRLALGRGILVVKEPECRGLARRLRQLRRLLGAALRFPEVLFWGYVWRSAGNSLRRGNPEKGG